MKALAGRALCVGLFLSTAAAGPVRGQDAPQPPRAETPDAVRPERLPLVPLNVQVVFTRLDGTKTVASLPYNLSVTTHGGKTSLRMGVEVPVATTHPGRENQPPQIQYRNVGMNIDCSAELLSGQRYKLDLRVEQSSIYVSDREKRSGSWLADAPLGGQPMFRTFNSNVTPILRDGGSSQFTVATDPVSGEVMRAEVTLHVVK